MLPYKHRIQWYRRSNRATSSWYLWHRNRFKEIKSNTKEYTLLEAIMIWRTSEQIWTIPPWGYIMCFRNNSSRTRWGSALLGCLSSIKLRVWWGAVCPNPALCSRIQIFWTWGCKSYRFKLIRIKLHNITLARDQCLWSKLLKIKTWW